MNNIQQQLLECEDLSYLQAGLESYAMMFWDKTTLSRMSPLTFHMMPIMSRVVIASNSHYQATVEFDEQER